MNDKIVNISFNIWANDASEALELQKQIFDFIDWFGERGIKVSASKLKEALSQWDKNALVRNHVINNFTKA